MQSFASFFYLPFFIYFLFFINSDKAPTPELGEGIGLPKLASTTSVGTIGGDFVVNGNGGATYSISIEVPPGTNGVQPDLSIHYNSQSGNGLLGVGWSINGISSIRRIGQSLDRDGAKRGVNLDNQDRFAIDGQALVPYRDANGKFFSSVAAANQAYGQDGIEYRTEIESWARIFSYGNSGNGPSYFVVWSKDGSVSQYGMTDDSRLEASDKSNGVVREWMVNQVQDRNGNYVTLQYVEDPQHEWYYPTAIYYTGNAKVGLSPQRAIFFEYEYRQDVIPLYVGGSKILNPMRMTGIKTYVDLDGDAQKVIDPKNLVKQYQLRYTYSNTTALSLLSSIAECDAVGTCLPATQITYGRGQKYDGTFNIVTPGNNQAGDPYQDYLRFDPGAFIIPGDFNGDGKVDFFRQTKAGWSDQGVGSYPNFQVYSSNGDGNFQIFTPGNNQVGDLFQDLLRSTGGATVLPGDFNGDGKMDFIRQEDGLFDDDYIKSFQVCFSNGDGTFRVVQPGQEEKRDVYQDNLRFDPGANIILGDYNGDGKTDFIRQEKGDWDDDDYELSFQIYYSNGDGTFRIFMPGVEEEQDLYQDSLRYDPGAIIVPGDYNGDGKTDFIRQETAEWGQDNKTTFKVFLADRDNAFKVIQPGMEFSTDPYQGDMKLDPGASIIPGDFNGDGKTDFIRQTHGDWTKVGYVKTFEVYFSKGDGTFDIVEPGKEQPKDPYQDDLKFDQGANIITGDYNGDGKTDFLRQERGTNDDDLYHSFQVYLSNGDGTFRIFQPGKEGSPEDPYQDWLRFDPGVNIIPGDYNGDGVTDFIRQEKGGFDGDINVSFQLYFSKSSAADLVTNITDGIGKQTAVDYGVLTDGQVYDLTDYFGFTSNVQVPLWVVSRHAEIAGQDTFKYRHQYKSAIIDPNRGWMGFAETYLYDLQNNTVTRTRHNYEFPLVGTISVRQTTDMTFRRTFGIVNSLYNYFRVPNTNVFRVYKKTYYVEHFTEGNLDYTLQKNFAYDANFKNVVSIQNLGDISLKGDEHYTYFQYSNYSSTSVNWWKNFYPILKKESADSISNLNSWDPQGDIEWEKYEYDSHMNQVAENVFLNTNGGDGANALSNIWIRTAYRFDSLGNMIRAYLPNSPNAYAQYQYDSTYFTFVKTQLSPTLTSGNVKFQIKTSAVYDPRFGVQVSATDVNGNRNFSIPDQGIDGLGRVLITNGIHDSNNTIVTFSKKELAKESDGGVSIKTRSRKDWDEEDVNTWLWHKTYHDPFGRNYKTEASAYQTGTTWVQKVTYNTRGAVDKEYLPYFYDAEGIRYSPSDSLRKARLYEQSLYDRYMRPESVLIPDPNKQNKLQVAQKIRYNLTDDRRIIFQLPDPNQDSTVVFWLQLADTYGRIIHKSGPYLDSSALKPIPGADTTLYKYDAVGNLIQVIDPKGEKSTFTYNSLNMLIAKFKPETGLKNYTYNDKGLLHKEKDAKGQSIGYTYDPIGRLISKATYTTYGKIEKIQKTIQYTYDNQSVKNGLGRLSKVSMPEGTYEFLYNNNGEVKEERVTLKGLDLNGDKIADPLITRYLYDAQGRLVQVTNPDQSMVNYEFSDYDGNLLSIKEQSGLNTQVNTLASYSRYNSNGVAEQANYGNGVNANWKYDVLGRIQSASMSKGSFIHQNFAYTWNRANKMKSIQDRRVTRDQDLSQTFAYDQIGRLISATGVYGKETYDYDPAGNRLLGNQSYYVYDINAKHKLNEVINPKTRAVLFTYTYDRNGNIIQKNNPNPTPDYDASTNGPFKASLTQYQYDEENRLVNVSINNQMVNRFTYDENGKRLSKMEADSTITYYVSPLYEVVRLPKGQFIHTRYTHGPEGVLQSRSKEGKSVTLLTAKDELGTIIHRKKDHWNPWPLYVRFLQVLFFGTLFALIGWSIKKEGQAWMEKLRGRVSPQLGGALVTVRAYVSVWTKTAQWAKRFGLGFLVWSFTMVSVIPLNAQQGSPPSGYPEVGEVRYFHQDHLNSSTILTDETGGQANRVSYTPFGTVDKKGSIGKNNFRPKFTGKELDEATALYYFGARYYDAQQGRFISPDPAQQYHSPYIYGADDPLSGVDPDGKFFVTLTLIIVGLIIGAYAGGAIANHDANPVNWDWKSGKTWAGIIVGGALGAAVGAFAGAGLAAAGVPIAASIGGVTATTIASTSIDVAFLAYDGYQFSQDHSAENGIYLALDMIPFVGALLGRGIKAIRGAAKAMTEASHEAETLAHEEKEAAVGESEMAEATCEMSFVEDTEVMTPEGNKPIQDIKVGDRVVGYNEQTNKTGLFAVSRVFQRVASTLLIIALAGDTIKVTPEHPFFIYGKGWSAAALLKAGDQLLNYDQTTAVVLSIGRLEREAKVYNFEVEEAHSYFVSEETLLVHNGRCLVRRSKRIQAHRVKDRNNLSNLPAKRTAKGVNRYGKGDGFFYPGPYANGSIRARGKAQTFTEAERREIDRIFKNSGCHRCGTKNLPPGKRAVPDHQPVSAFIGDNVKQNLYPHCPSCSSKQGGKTSKLLLAGENPYK